LHSSILKCERFESRRILAFLDPMRYDGPAAYHLRQSFIAIGSGGLSGVGLGQIAGLPSWSVLRGTCGPRSSSLATSG